jgi:uncharacterized protein YndB with AHSA1/START domain
MLTTITISRTVPALPERAYAAWIEPEQLATWWWPHLPDTTYEVDARPGGSYRIDSPTAGIRVEGTFTEVEPARRLVYTWLWSSGGDGDVPEDVVEVTFEPDGAGTTIVTVRHTSVEDIAQGGAEQGWNDVMNRLAAVD